MANASSVLRPLPFVLLQLSPNHRIPGRGQEGLPPILYLQSRRLDKATQVFTMHDFFLVFKGSKLECKISREVVSLGEKLKKKKRPKTFV